jgi:hypothetical protein
MASIDISSMGIGSIGIFICCSMPSMLSVGGFIIFMPLCMGMAMGGWGQFDG